MPNDIGFNEEPPNTPPPVPAKARRKRAVITKEPAVAAKDAAPQSPIAENPVPQPESMLATAGINDSMDVGVSTVGIDALDDTDRPPPEPARPIEQIQDELNM